MSELKKVAYYTALGTPENDQRVLLPEVFAAEIEDQIASGCSGLFVLGSMGYGLQVRECNQIPAIRTAIEAARGRVPVLAMVTDLSIGRIIDRIGNIVAAGLKPDGVFLYTPCLYKMSDADIVNVFTRVAKASPFPLYLYDLPSVARNKITEELLLRSLEQTNNIVGLKSGDVDLCLAVHRGKETGKFPASFKVMCSNLDRFDEVIRAGIPYQLDGMFACTGPLAKEMYVSYNAGDFERGKHYLDRIIDLRNVFLKGSVYRLFTEAMNALGYEGNFHPDTDAQITDEQKKLVRDWLREEGLTE